jgi:hypothetical protein
VVLETHNAGLPVLVIPQIREPPILPNNDCGVVMVVVVTMAVVTIRLRKRAGRKESDKSK